MASDLELAPERVILVVDEDAAQCRYLFHLLTDAGFNVRIAQSVARARDIISRAAPILVMADLRTRGDGDGLELCRAITGRPDTACIPVIATGSTDRLVDKVRAFRAGAQDFIVKPLEAEELLSRVATQLQARERRMRLERSNAGLAAANRRLEDQARLLEHRLSDQAEQIERINVALVRALERANSFNDDDTGDHVVRVGEYAALVAELYGCDASYVERIRLYAPLHDVGKVGLADAILKKAGRYTAEEREQMKEHVRIGAAMLASEDVDLVAQNIVRYHHERWDGSGYLEGLSGSEIPLEARIVALADVYDALLSRRAYKDALPHDEVERIVEELRARHFDPDLTDLLLLNRERFRRIRSGGLEEIA